MNIIDFEVALLLLVMGGLYIGTILILKYKTKVPLHKNFGISGTIMAIPVSVVTLYHFYENKTLDSIVVLGSVALPTIIYFAIPPLMKSYLDSYEQRNKIFKANKKSSKKKFKEVNLSNRK